MGRRFEIAEEVYEEVVWVCAAGIFVLGGVGLVGVGVGSIMVAFRWIRVPVGEYYDFVYAEDGEGAGNMAGHGGSQFVGLAAFEGLARYVLVGK